MTTAGQNDPESKPRSIQHSFTEGILPNGILSHHLNPTASSQPTCGGFVCQLLTAGEGQLATPWRVPPAAMAMPNCTPAPHQSCKQRWERTRGGQPGEGSQGRGPQGQASGPHEWHRAAQLLNTTMRGQQPCLLQLLSPPGARAERGAVPAGSSLP